MTLEILTAKELAKLMRVSPDTIYALAARGELPGRRVGRIWRFPKDAIETYIREQISPLPVTRDRLWSDSERLAFGSANQASSAEGMS
ncbi:MAG: helix-turn-helix domain-containing protein [Planctomycetes bacterium]|nr:helix-turn-helix domain-containing protein [Planctomycetota bacterium]